MHTESPDDMSNAKSSDLIDLNSPTTFFHTSDTIQRSDSVERDSTNNLGTREFGGFLNPLSMAAKPLQDISQQLHLAGTSNNQLNVFSEDFGAKDAQNSSLKSPVAAAGKRDVPKLVSFVCEEQRSLDDSFSSLREFKDSGIKRDTDGESSELSFELLSMEKFRLMEDRSFVQSSIIDQDLHRVESLLEGWTSDLKKKILAEFSQSKIRLLEYYRQQIALVKEKQNSDLSRLQKENDSLRELTKNFEKSLERKDEIIAGLGSDVQSCRNKMQLQKYFSDWRIKQNDSDRDNFASNLARRHYRRVLTKKVWAAWHSVLENNWKEQIQKSCQSKVEEVCQQTNKDCENKLASMNQILEQSKKEMERLYKEREMYENTMKKAFMRGVCALNLEAMSIFQEKDASAADGRSARAEDARTTHDLLPRPVESHSSNCSLRTSAQAPQHDESIYFSDPTPPARTPSFKKPTALHLPIKTKLNHPKVVREKRGSAITSSLMGSALAPPMTSVVVERHHPINKETIGQAYASKFPIDIVRSTSTSSLKKRPGHLPSRVIKVTN